ncbi:MAG TPA: DOMON domain-containing protein [Desulfopila sp.]|nr:DOMON domain-containing protein [Desulfopila sp.]
MKKRILNVLLGSIVALYSSGATAAESYDHAVEEDGIKMFWKVTDDDLHVKVTAETSGWVGVGFNPTEQMKGANYIIGYIKNGEVVLHDDFGDEKWNHSEDTSLGGTDDLTIVDGLESEGHTTLEFFLPLDSGDDYDGVIDPQGRTVVLLAYGGKRDSLRAIHRYRTTLTVNLATGRRE